MPGTSKAINPRGIEIVFEELTHKYTSIVNGQEINYTSGTKFIEQFFKPFDPDNKIAERCAKKEGVSVEEIKAKWAANGKESCRLGTRCHELCEDIELGNVIRNKPENDIEAKRFKYASTLAQNLKNKIDIIGVEKIVFSDRLSNPIAGTIDLLGRSRKDGSYLILDWKTNKTIDQDNQYKNFGLDPIETVPDTNFGHYSLQLSLYQYLLQLEGYVPKNSIFQRALLHVTENGSQIIKCPDYTSYIKDMIIWSTLRK